MLPSKCASDHQGSSRVTYTQAPEGNKHAQSLKGLTWVCGSDATALDIRDQVFENRSDGKVKLALQLFLSAVAQLPIQRKHWEFRLVGSIHDAEVFGDKLKASLEGRHVAIIHGVETTVVIHVVKIFDEGYVFKQAIALWWLVEVLVCHSLTRILRKNLTFSISKHLS